MKRILFLLPAFVLCLLFSQRATAQISASSEPRAQVTASGEVIIMPFIPKAADAIAVSVQKPTRKQAARMGNKARKNSLLKFQNGYYKMAANQDWGSNYRLGHFGMARLN